LSKLSRKSETTVAIRYALSRWDAFVRYIEDGHIEIDKAMVSYCTSLWGLSWARVSSVC
jgi:hypothetical protein